MGSNELPEQFTNLNPAIPDPEDLQICLKNLSS